MSQMEINRVLAQIRSMSHVAKGAAPGGVAPTAVAGGDNGFAKLLKQGLDSVN